MFTNKKLSADEILIWQEIRKIELEEKENATLSNDTELFLQSLFDEFTSTK